MSDAKSDKQEFPETVLATLQNLPHEPGVYKYFDTDGDLLYIGKAKDLAKRVRSYFRDNDQHKPKTKRMVAKIAEIEFIVVNSELEALILETNLIKEMRPYYNVLMKDDKNYVYVRITVQDDFPRISLVRKLQKDGARYFGPKTEAWKVKQTLKLLKKMFPYRHCALTIDWQQNKTDHPVVEQRVEIGNKVIKYPCLDYHIKRCVGPCTGKVTPAEYRELIEQITAFFEGDVAILADRVTQQMHELAKERKFEQAAQLRDRLQFLQDIQEKQQISAPTDEDLDVVNFSMTQGHYFFNLLQVRKGRMIGNEQFALKTELFGDNDEDDASVLQSFLTQYYQSTEVFPQVVIVPRVLPEADLLTTWLTERSGRVVKLQSPARGRKFELLELALKNARSYAKQMQVKWLSEEKRDPSVVLKEMKEVLNLPRIPKRIECYDISHLGGTNTVGSMAVLVNGVTKTSDYRQFNIRSLESGEIDDFASMREVMARRFKYLLQLPDEWRLAKPNKKLQKQLIEQEWFAGKEIDQVDWDRVWGLTVKKKLVAFVIVTDVDQFVWRFLDEDFLQKKLLLLTALRQVFRKLNLKKIYLKRVILEEAKVKEYELGAVVDRLDDTQLVLEQYRFSFTDKSLQKKPDLVVIDGGKGQLSAAANIFADLGITKSVPLISLAKRFEEIFLPGQKLSIQLTENDAMRLLLQQIRDEAHRFAVSANRKKRAHELTKTALDDVPGVGEATRKKLLQHFGSVAKIAEASEAELSELTNKRVAKALKQYL